MLYSGAEVGVVAALHYYPSCRSGVNGQFSTANCQPLIANHCRQLLTANL